MKMKKNPFKKIFRCIKNYFFCKRYPFMQARNVWTGEPCGYEFTWYDDIPKGWRKAFGKQFLKELKRVLKKNNEMESFRFHQIKEKYGSLRLYSGSATSETLNVLLKYESLSEKYCYFCGKPVKYETQGYILYVCEKCFEREIQRRAHQLDTFEKIEAYKEECRLK